MEIRKIPHGSAAYRDTVALRDRILRAPLGLKFDENDLQREASEIHIACYCEGDSFPVGCAILCPSGEDAAVKMRQLAIDENAQGRGIGTTLVEFCEQETRELGKDLLFCHARIQAAVFYEKLGYRKTGEPFEEVGLPHVRMEKEL